MRRLLTAVVLCMSICLFGYTANAVGDEAPQKASSPFIKCTTCGQEFTTQQGLQEHYKSHPDHQSTAPPVRRSAAIRCSTCGQEFTVQQGVDAYDSAHPVHNH